MGILDAIFGKKHTDDLRSLTDSQNWNDIVYTRKNVDMDDPVQRREYIGSCLLQMQEASRELEELEFEYKDVTSHLRDMEEIDALPPEHRAEINACAEKILESQKQKEKFSNRKSKMTDAEFERMDRLQKDARSGIAKLSEAEDYQKKIRNTDQECFGDSLLCSASS